MSNDPAIATVLNLTIRDRHRLTTPFVFVDSPPGAGKTTLIELVATSACAHGLSVAIACPRVQQAVALVHRLLDAYPGQSLRLHMGQDRTLPAHLRDRVRSSGPGEYSFGPAHGREIEIGTLSKLPYVRTGLMPYDLLVCDEASQATLADFLPNLDLAVRFLLVGDPGQLPPVVQIDTEPFQAAHYRVHAPAPAELLRHAPRSPVVRLKVSHRLPHDSVRILQPAFYPTLPFRAGAARGQRRLMTRSPGHHGDAVDRAVDTLVGGASLVALVLPAASGLPSVVDTKATTLMADVVQRLLDRQIGPASGRTVRLEEIGCVEPHVASGAHLRRTLQQRQVSVGSLLIDTPEVWQGLQRALMVIRHPVSDAFPSAFDLAPGRLCVAVSRHRFGCIIVAREGVGDVMSRYQLDSGARPLGSLDEVWRGLQAHQHFWEALRRRGRLIHV